MKQKNILKTAAFGVIFVLLFSQVSKIMTNPADYRNYQWIGGFYEEPKNSLDAVYIGSSSCYAFWNPLVAWEEYGLTVYPYTSNAQPFAAAKYLIRETKKRQPDALFIVNINTLEENSLKTKNIHHLLDYMPFSLNKIALTKHLADAAGCTFKESLELYLPIIRYHERWTELNPKDFQYEIDGMKGVSSYHSFLNISEDVSEIYITSDEEAELEAEILQQVNDLLDYCDEEKVNVLFVTVPRAEDSEAMVQKYNKVNAIIVSRGYPVLDLNDKVEELGLDLTQDFYNEKHTNIHGAIKFTNYLSEYLIENYGLKNKRGNEEYKSWEEAWLRYADTIAPYTVSIEMDGTPRTDDLDMPEELTVSLNEEGVSVSWLPVEGADGYVVYRKAGVDRAWVQLTDSAIPEYKDVDIESDTRYYYTVVPFYEKEGVRYYGSFSYSGARL